PVEALMPLRLARYGIPLAETAPLGLAAAGITLPEPAPAPEPAPVPALVLEPVHPAERGARPQPAQEAAPEPAPAQPPVREPARARIPVPAPTPDPAPAPVPEPLPDSRPTVPVSPGRVRTLANGYGTAQVSAYAPEPDPDPEPEPTRAPEPDPDTEPEPALHRPPHIEPDVPREEQYYGAFRRYVVDFKEFPNPRQFGRYLLENYGVTGRTGGPLSEGTLRRYLTEFESQYRTEWDSEQVP
ncbi:hypothetical protein ABZ721_39070, partial [Streptomyces sp. NPDC006733]